MFSEVHKRVKKAGKPPGTLTYTGDHTEGTPVVTVITYSSGDFHEVCDTSMEKCLPPGQTYKGTTWINVEGLHDVNFIKSLADHYHLHPLTLEDILNVGQRPKVEEFKDYLFITLKVLLKQRDPHFFAIKQISIILGKDFILTFQELDTTLFDSIRAKLRSQSSQTLRKEGASYLMYRLIDAIVDDYFFTLETLGDQIEKIEENIIASPTPQNSRTIYRLKRQMLILRKAIWPMRELLSHLTHADSNLVSKFTSVYLRDVYDHSVQAIDTLETFRDMISGMLDMYLSSITNRMSEIMKTLTIITTIFIPITAIASIYGMNFQYIPGLRSEWGYVFALFLMVLIAGLMLFYFRRKKWI